MCTVSFIQHKSQTILTSNRDEHHSRPNAFPPSIYQSGNYTLIYCKDAMANGTWMVLRNDNTVIVLLNGAFIRHEMRPVYKKSRGLIVLEIINDKNCLNKFIEYDFTNIEPFTIVLYSNNRLHECIWNGDKKFVTEKPTKESHIWSSVTLYDEDVRQKKQELFQHFLQANTEPDQSEILEFHHSAQDLENGFIINRNNQLLTFSISQAILTDTAATFHHHDIIENKEYTISQNGIPEKVLL